MQPNDVMKYETILPSNFNGVFQFTNYSDEDFVGKWGGKEYIYPAQSTSAMIIPEHSPLEIQNIRKKFAKDLAEREYFKGQQYKTLAVQEGTPGNRTMSSIQQAGTYSMQDLTSLIQRALEELPISQAIVQESHRPKLEEILTKDEDGNLNTGAIKTEKDLEKLAKGKD